MSLLLWKPSFSLGIPSVDLEHRELIEMINTLHGRLQGNEEPMQVTMALAEIHAAIAAHFALEERLMRQANYKDLEPHMAEHKKLLGQLDDLARKHMLDDKPIYFES